MTTDTKVYHNHKHPILKYLFIVSNNTVENGSIEVITFCAKSNLLLRQVP